jgi:hypothetical protein
MGRTIRSFKIALAMEKEEWKPFRNALDKKEKRDFDDMFDTPKLYICACSNSCQLVPLHPIVMSILYHQYKELKECIKQVEQTEARVNRSN